MDQELMQQRINFIKNKFIEYNKINNEIKRFGNLFNTFIVNYLIQENRICFEVKSGDVDERLTASTFGTENWIDINVEKDNEINWLIKIINKLLEKARLIMKKAREFSKPHVGILSYDEFTDSYYLNPISGPILLKSKVIEREISTTRIDIFNVFIHLRTLVIDKDTCADIFGLSNQEVVDTILELIKRIKIISNKLLKIEGIPCFQVEFKLENEKEAINYNSYITIMFEQGTIIDQETNEKINEINLTASIDCQEELQKVYVQVKRDAEVSKQLASLARCLVSKNDPKLYIQNINTKHWTLTKEGKETIKDLNIIDFINNDISEINFSIN